MKPSPGIVVNFASTDYRLLARIHTGLLAACALLALLLAVNVGAALSYRADIAVGKRTLAALAARDEAIKPVLMEREQLVRELGAMSALLDAKRFSWTRFLTAVEEVFPLGVALGAVAVNPKSGSLTLQGAALSPEALRNLMVGLERSRTFAEPFLKHQSLDKGNISFDVAARYREDKTSGPAPAPPAAPGK